MSVYFFINDIHNVGSITVKQALHIGQNISQYVIKKDDAEYEEFLKEKLSSFECILLGIEKNLAAFDYYRIIRGIQEVFKLLTEMFRFRTYKHKETQVSIEDFLCKYDRFAYL